MDFQTAVRTCLTKYADFKGRAGRGEFWWFMLFCFIVSSGAGLVGSLAGEDASNALASLVSFALLLPNLAVGARRLHDIGKSGWWQLLALTVIGVVVLIYWWVQPSKNEINAYGAPPV